MHDYYELLGLDPNASSDEVRRAYKRKILDAHPDRKGGDPELARLLDEARTVLLDPTKRAEYDARRLGSDFVDEALDALTDIGERAVDRLGATVQARGRDLIGMLRSHVRFGPKRKR